MEKKEGEGEREKRGREENRFESNETAGDGGEKEEREREPRDSSRESLTFGAERGGFLWN